MESNVMIANSNIWFLRTGMVKESTKSINVHLEDTVAGPQSFIKKITCFGGNLILMESWMAWYWSYETVSKLTQEEYGLWTMNWHDSLKRAIHLPFSVRENTTHECFIEKYYYVVLWSDKVRIK